MNVFEQNTPTDAHNSIERNRSVMELREKYWFHIFVAGSEFLLPMVYIEGDGSKDSRPFAMPWLDASHDPVLAQAAERAMRQLFNRFGGDVVIYRGSSRSEVFIRRALNGNTSILHVVLPSGPDYASVASVSEDNSVISYRPATGEQRFIGRFPGTIEYLREYQREGRKIVVAEGVRLKGGTVEAMVDVLPGVKPDYVAMLACVVPMSPWLANVDELNSICAISLPKFYVDTQEKLVVPSSETAWETDIPHAITIATMEKPLDLPNYPQGSGKIPHAIIP